MGKKCTITNKEIIRQVVSDWFGKEVQTGYTTTYLWIANQFGHFNLGFLATLIIVWIVKIFHPDISPYGLLLIVPISEIAIWIIKESYDYKVAIKTALKNDVFPPDKRDVALDAGTAVLFISFGIMVAYLSFISLTIAVFSFVVVFILALFPGKYWLTRKICFQQADLPYQFRLSDFTLKIGKEMVNQVTNFFKVEQGSFKHLVILGERQTGKTNLAVGVGTESSFILNKVRYSTYFKFLQLVEEDTSTRKYFNGKYIWNWNEVEILVIDDVNPVSEIGELIDPSEVGASINALDVKTKEELLNTKTVWVIGLPENFSEKDVTDWHEMFANSLNTSIDDIGAIVLSRQSETNVS